MNMPNAITVEQLYRLDLAAESAGLLAVSDGLSHIYKDDLKLLEAAMLIYDAYYQRAINA